MTTAGEKTALELALTEYAAGERKKVETQPDLFAGAPADLSPVVDAGDRTGSRGAGRPPGARNKRTDALSKWYIAKNDGRDPLERGIEIAGLPILARGILEGLAERLQCSRHDAAKFWQSCLATVLPYTHQRLAQLEVKPAGSPGGDPIVWSFAEDGTIEMSGDDVATIEDITASGLLTGDD